MVRPASPRIIKKYGNRRLYDTVESRYVTLDELAGSIRAGHEVRVVDAQTGGDLTQATLAQIILEGRGAAQFLSVPILTQLVRMNDDALAEFFGRWVTLAMELFNQARKPLQGLGPFNPLGVPYAAGNALARVLNHALPAAPRAAAEAPPPAAPEPPPPPELDPVESLRRELDELKQAIRQGATVRKPARKPARR